MGQIFYKITVDQIEKTIEALTGRMIPKPISTCSTNEITPTFAGVLVTCCSRLRVVTDLRRGHELRSTFSGQRLRSVSESQFAGYSHQVLLSTSNIGCDSSVRPTVTPCFASISCRCRQQSLCLSRFDVQPARWMRPSHTEQIDQSAPLADSLHRCRAIVFPLKVASRG